MMFSDNDFLNLLAETGYSFNPDDEPNPPSLQTLSGIALLHFSISRGIVKDVANLLKIGISLKTKISDNITAIYRAIQHGHAEIVDLLISYGADVHEKTDSGTSFLHHAVSRGYADVVDVLIAAGLNVDMKDHEGLPPIYRAAERDDFDTAQVLFENGAEEYTESGIPLIHLAVSRNCSNAVRCFADLGLDLDILDSSLETPLYKAAKSGNLKLVQELIENGADLNVRDLEGNSLLHIAARECDLTAMKTFLDAGFEVDVKGGWWNWTPLHVAAGRGNLHVVKYLLSKNASLEAKTSDGRTVLNIAESNGDSAMKCLITNWKS